MHVLYVYKQDMEITWKYIEHVVRMYNALGIDDPQHRLAKDIYVVLPQTIKEDKYVKEHNLWNTRCIQIHLQQAAQL